MPIIEPNLSEEVKAYIAKECHRIYNKHMMTHAQIINFLKSTLEKIAPENMKSESDRTELLRCVALAENAIVVGIDMIKNIDKPRKSDCDKMTQECDRMTQG